MSTVIEPDAAQLGAALARHFEATAREAITLRGAFCCALTGGSAATALYPHLVKADVDWAKVQLYFGDERCVPPGDALSNFRLANEVLLQPARVPAANVHRMAGEGPAAEAAAAYARALPLLDVVHLGLGPDGHVCSLFPGHPLLDEATARVAALDDAPKPPPARLTLTLPALKEARALWFLVLGAPKADAVREALTDPRSPLPAARAHRAATSSTWFLDAAAAAQLP